MSTLINKIEQLIKREKTTPDRQKKDDSKKSSNEILSELFGVFNAEPPKIDESTLKKSKKSKRKHKKEKKKRSRSKSNDSNGSHYSHKHKKRKKSKSKKKRLSVSSESSKAGTPPRHIIETKKLKLEVDQIKKESKKVKVKTENITVKSEEKRLEFKNIEIKKEDSKECILIDSNSIDASLIPMPDSPKEAQVDYSESTLKLEDKKLDAAGGDNDKGKGKIQIKNLKFSAVFEEAVKQAEEVARKKAEKYEEGECTDSSTSTEKEEPINSEFPKSSDPGGILKKQAAEETKIVNGKDSNHIKKIKNSDRTTRKKSRDRSRSRRRSKSRSRRSRSHSSSRRRRKRSTSRTRNRSRSKRRSTSRSRQRSRHHSPRHRSRRSRSATGVKLADSEKKRLLEVARRNAINMLKNGAVPAGAAALPPHTRNQVMAAIQSGGKSVDELTDFCKHLSKKEALGELSSVSEDDDMSENEDTLAFHHPFLVKEKAPIVMNIRGGAPLPIKTPLAIANKDELRIQFPVSSGCQHREKAIEWVPVSPTRKDMQVAKLNQKNPKTSITANTTEKSEILALPEPPTNTAPVCMKGFTTGDSLSSVPALTAPGPQAYPPGVTTVKDIAAIVSEKLMAIRKEQEQTELALLPHGFGWGSRDTHLGQFMGSTGAQILTPKELASGTQAWAKKDQLTRAAPVEGGMGMHLLQKMGWTPGQGLGKEGTGTLQPLLLEVKLDTRGLQAKEEMKHQRIATRRPGIQAPLISGGKHPVSLLGEYCSKQKLGPPEYNLCFECGPDHKKNFLFKVKVAGVEYQPAVASANKKQAKADSAHLALQKLGILP